MKWTIKVVLCLFLISAASIVAAEASQDSLQRQAEQGVPRAQAVLCAKYSYGQGVPQNYREAAYWCRRAADQGSPEGQYLLGLMYDKGQGVPRDFLLAYKWLDLAAARVSGNRRDLFYRIRDSVATKLTPVQVDFAQQIALEWEPIFERVR
jgi:TPR repeat protein